MKKSLYSISIATVLALASISVQAAGEDLVYVAVEPCRIVDTRNAGGPITANTSRAFLASGSAAELAAQGGTADCLNPKGSSTKALAVVAYVLAVPPGPGSTAGVLTAFPAGQPDPAPGTGSTVNFAAQQVIGNTTTITLCDTCADDFAILARTTNQQVVVDVQGYFFPGGGSGSCSADMVAVGSLCVDKYEASLVDSSGNPISPAGSKPFYPCAADGSGCSTDTVVDGVPTLTAIFAQSVAGVLPASGTSWFQAAIACANVGKRLPSSAEWQMAAAGTVAGTGSAPDCNSSTGNVLANTGASANCISTAGAFDMVGNLWEWTADLRSDVNTGSTSANTSFAAGFGESYAGNVDPTPGTDSMFTPGSGAVAENPVFGFRCVR